VSVSELNRGFLYVERLPPAAEGRTLLSYLSSAHRHSSEGEWRSHIENGLVLVEGRPAGVARLLRPGETLVWNRPPWREPDVPTSFAVLHRDDDVVAVAKPAGLPTMPGGGFLERTLLHRVRRSFPEASPLHRLGRGTSGIVLFTRNRVSRRKLASSWSTGRVERRYRALVTGRFPDGPDGPGANMLLDYPIGPVPHRRLGSVQAFRADGKPSRSRVRLVEAREESSLVEIEIETGRTHQIRIHLAAFGHPLLGDPLYPTGGVPDPGTEVLPGEIGYRLHAYRLGFVHPRTDAWTSIDCGPPELYRARGE
jgi:23S rRNA pseudouridine1911/1915/1917 synthase